MPPIPFIPIPHACPGSAQPCPTPDVLMFETEDLVLRKNEKNFVLCLLELARRAARFGMRAPTLVQMEEEIEEELRQELDLPPADTPLPRPPRKPRDLHNLDQMVQMGVEPGMGMEPGLGLGLGLRTGPGVGIQMDLATSGPFGGALMGPPISAHRCSTW